MADPNPIKQRIEVEADQAKRELDQVAEGTRNLDRATEDTTRTTERAEQAQHKATDTMRDAGRETDETAHKQGLLGRVMGGVIGAIGGMVSGIVGVGGLVHAFRALNEAADEHIQRLEKIVELQNKAARATLDLHAINQTFDQGEEDFVQAFSNITGRDFTESAGVITQFRSANAALSREKQNELINRSLIPLALSTDQDLDALAKFIGRVAPTTSDPREINNLVTQSISLAGEANPAEFLGRAGELLVAGNAAGLDSAETLALLAFGSSKIETAQAQTQLRNVFKKLSADPQVRSRLEQGGVSVEGDPLDILRRLEVANPGPDQIVDLFGLENSDIVQAMLYEIDTVNRFVDETRSAVDGPDKATAFINDLVTKNPQAARALQIAQQEQAIEAEKRKDQSAQIIEIARNSLELELEKAVQAGDIETSVKNSRLEKFDELVGGVKGRNLAATYIGKGLIKPTPDQVGVPSDLLFHTDITTKQIVEAAAIKLETGHIGTLVPGGDSTKYIELSDPVRDAVNRGPDVPSLSEEEREKIGRAVVDQLELRGINTGQQTVVRIERLSINNGTEFRGGRDPYEDDQDGSYG